MPNIQDDGLMVSSRFPVYKFVKGQINNSDYQDPTYLGFVLLFDITSPLLNKEELKAGTALTYLKNIGENLRAEYLKNFIENLLLINKEMPWYWQSLSGCENLWKFDGFKDPYKGGNDSNIIIECLESIDLRITMLMDLYRKAVYDQEYKRIILPANLRKFDMWIYIQEIRKFQIEQFLENNSGMASNINSEMTNITIADGLSNKIDINKNMPYIMWHLKYCEFDPDASFEPFSELNMRHGESSGFAKQKLSINYELVLEEGNFYINLGSTISTTDPNISAKNGSIGSNVFNDVPDGDNRSNFQRRMDASKKRIDSVNKNNLQQRLEASKKHLEDFGKRQINEIKERAQNLPSRFIGNIFSDAENFIKSKITKVLLGNVYGATNNIIRTLEQGSIASLGPNLINQINQSKNSNNSNKFLGNIYK